MPVEASRTEEMQFAYGEEMADHIQTFDPDIVKTLVFHSVTDDVGRKGRQLGRLRLLAQWCELNQRPLMIEVLIASLVSQAEPYSHDRILLDELHGSIAELQSEGLAPAIWKIDGFDTPSHAKQIAEQAQGQSPAGRCIVLGSGASLEQVSLWLRNAAMSPGYSGFAVGRSVWTDPLGAYFEGTIDRTEAINEVADRFANLVRIYTDAVSE